MRKLRKWFALRYLLPLTFLGVLAFILGQGLQSDPTVIPSALIDHKLPTLILPTLTDETPTSMNKSIRGKVTLINVWASWCTTCLAEHVMIEKISKIPRVNLVGLAYKDSRVNINGWLKTLGNPYQQVWLDETGKAAIDLGVYGTPESYLIDKKGMVKYRHTGLLTKTILNDEIEPMIERLNLERNG